MQNTALSVPQNDTPEQGPTPRRFDPVYGVREAFEVHRISAPTGYSLVHSGQIKTYRIGTSRA
jgi:hypothetical protein